MIVCVCVLVYQIVYFTVQNEQTTKIDASVNIKVYTFHGFISRLIMNE